MQAAQKKYTNKRTTEKPRKQKKTNTYKQKRNREEARTEHKT